MRHVPYVTLTQHYLAAGGLTLLVNIQHSAEHGCDAATTAAAECLSVSIGVALASIMPPGATL